MPKIPIITLFLILLSLPAQAAWKRDGTTLWQSGYTAKQKSSVTYSGIPKTKSIKADKCAVIRIPGKKADGNYYSSSGPIGVGGLSFTNLATTASSYIYKCKQNPVTKAYVPQFDNGSPVYPGQSDYRGNIYVGGSGITAGNSYTATWKSFKYRNITANTCGIAVLKSNSSTDHTTIGKIDGTLISVLSTGTLPVCKNGVIQ
jgi:hypothetical protein